MFHHFCIMMILTIISLPCWSQTSPTPETPTLEKVSLQLKWFNQFQFAGYYAAIEKGFYAEEGLDVDIKERNLEQNFVAQIVVGDSEYGVGDSGLLSQYARGEPIVALAAIFQHDPLVFFTKHDSGIISPYEMAGKRIMSDIISTNEASIRAMLVGANITEKDYTLIPQSNDYHALTRGEVDVISGYLTDQAFFFKQHGLKVNIVNPQHYGVDFYGDILFTSEKEIIEHPGRTERFRRASIKGWRYAIEHPEELVQIISEKYHSKLSIEHLRFEAAETIKLILADIIPLGQIEPHRLKMAAEAYAATGFNRTLTDEEVADFVFNRKDTHLNLTEKEQAWLDEHPVIRVGIDRDFPPYEWVDKNGDYIGLAADYMSLIEEQLGIKFDIIKNKSWPDILSMAQKGELHLLSCAVKTPERSHYLTFSEPYKSTRAIIIDNGSGKFIESLRSLTGKTVAVEKGYFTHELLKNNHPNIKLHLTGTTKEALELVAEGEADAYVGDAGVANYVIKANGLLTLRFSGQTEYSSHHSVAVLKSHPELTSIINKAMDNIPSEEADVMFNRWLGLKIEEGITLTSLLKYVFGLILLFVFFGYWAYRMRREISVRARTEEKLIESESRFRELFENTPVAYQSLNIEGQFIDVNQQLCDMLGYSREELLEKHFDDIWLEETKPHFLPKFSEFKNSGSLGTHLTLKKKNDELIIVLLNGRIQRDTNGNFLRTHCVLADITEREQVAEELRIAATAFESQEGMMVTDASGNILRTNKAFTTITGYSPEEVKGKNPSFLSSGKHNAHFYASMRKSLGITGAWEGEIWDRRKSGETYPQHLAITAVKDNEGKITNYVATMSDITHSKAAADKIHELAFYDPLTELPNRRLLMDRMTHVLASSTRSRYKGGLLFLDIDNFKTLNDTLGHDVGDILLKQIASRLQDCVREEDTVSRLGGDEFVVMLEVLDKDTTQATVHAQATAKKISEALNQIYYLEEHEYHCSCSIGIVIFNDHDYPPEVLLRHADIAMYKAKQDGRNTIRIFDPKMQAEVTSRSELERELRYAISCQQFQLYYQVQVNTLNQPIGAEALIRWVHPEHGLIPPIKFIPLAEETGLILHLGQWVLDSACAQIKLWQQQGLSDDFDLSINVSAKQFHQANFVDQVTSAIQNHDIDPSSLKLELTESILLESIDDAITTMHSLKKLGVKFSLDDFGTGYSSLQYLKRLPLDELKIDQSFVRDIVEDDNDRVIVRTILAMAQSLNLDIIAEGVETQEQRDILLSEGCAQFQGYFFSKPVPINEINTWMEIFFQLDLNQHSHADFG